MADTPTKGNQKPTFEASVITGLYFLVNKFITNPDLKAGANTVAPFAGGFLAYWARRGGQHIRYLKLRKIEEDYLQEARSKRAVAVDAKERTKLDKEIAKRLGVLEKMRKDNVLF